jgi:hypothetical protein
MCQEYVNVGWHKAVLGPTGYAQHVVPYKLFAFMSCVSTRLQGHV